MAEEKPKRTKGKMGVEGVVIPEHQAVPFTPENLHIKKAEFIARRKKEQEKAIKIAEYSKTLDKEEKVKEKK